MYRRWLLAPLAPTKTTKLPSGATAGSPTPVTPGGLGMTRRMVLASAVTGAGDAHRPAEKASAIATAPMAIGHHARDRAATGAATSTLPPSRETSSRTMR